MFQPKDTRGIQCHRLTDVQTAKSKHPQKTSKAFKQIFGVGKAEYAIIISDYYKTNSVAHPLEDMIRKIYKDDIVNINV